MLDIEPHLRKFHLDFKEFFEGKGGGGVTMVANAAEHSVSRMPSCLGPHPSLPQATLFWLHDGGEQGRWK